MDAITLSHWERVVRQRRVRVAHSTIPSIFANRGTGFPHPALRATFSQWEKDTTQQLSAI
jgi:hypothetical protein